MALPTTITGLGNVALTTTKPFISSSGNVYVIGRDSSDTDLMRAFKATDPTSSFSNVGTDVDVHSGATWPISVIHACQVGDVLHVVTVVSLDVDNNHIHYHTFNMSSDSWTITNEDIRGSAYRVVTSSGRDKASIAVRSDGDVIVLYNGQFVNNMGSPRERVYYARRESSTWTVDVAVDDGGGTHWVAGGTVIGSSDRMHFFFLDEGAFDAYQRTLTSANALQTFPSSFDTDIEVSNASLGFTQTGASYVSGANTKVRYPYGDNTTGEINSAKCDSADTPTMSVDTDITGATSAINNQQHAESFSADGTTLWNTFVDSSGSDIYTQSNADDGGWDTPASFYTGTVGGLKTNIYTRSGSVVIGIIFGESSNIKYHEKTLSAGTTNADCDMDAAASVTWTGASTARSNLDSDAAASVTWNGRSTASVTYDMDAAASVTWDGEEVTLVIEAADWSSTAAASLTWTGVTLLSGEWSSTAAASLTWTGITFLSGDWSSAATASVTFNGAAVAASDLNSDAVASVTWNGISTAASNLDADSAALLTWNGAAIAASDWSATTLASVTWNGVALTVSAGAWSAAATATLSLVGESTASTNWSSAAAAVVTFNGEATSESAWSAAAAASATFIAEAGAAYWEAAATASLAAAGAAVAASDWTSAAAATITWGGQEVTAGAWSAAAAASLTAVGASTNTANWASAALANLTMAGASVVAADWASTSAAALTMEGASVFSAAWSAAAIASVTWDGEEVSGAISEGAASITAVALAEFTGESFAAGSFQSDAVATLTVTGIDATPAAAATRYDGWRIRQQQQLEIEEQEEDDIMIITAAIVAYLEQNHVNY